MNTLFLNRVKDKQLLLVCTFLLFGLLGFSQVSTVKDSLVKKDAVTKIKTKSIKFNGEDGPYIIGDTLYRVTADNKLIKKAHFTRDSIIVRVDNMDKDAFYLTICSKYTIPKSIYPAPKNMVVISDIEGKYNAFVSFLYANKVIDKNHNWIYNDGRLVLVGDFVDRGKNVTQVLWLIYKLEQQAEKKGGKVHFILGNHEVLNFHGNHKYNHGKYIKVAQDISGIQDKRKAVQYIFSKHTELGKWLATKNVIEQIGSYLFVHAGLSPELLDYELSLDDINKKVRTQFEGLDENLDEVTNFLYGSKGPFWYRGLVTSNLKYSKITQKELDDILRYYNIQKIIIGHTVVNTVSSAYNGKVIRLDVSHGKKKFSGKTKGLLITNGKEFIIDDKGNKTELKN